jgi:hypothetical protein
MSVYIRYTYHTHLHALVHEEVLADLAEHLRGLMHIWGRRRSIKFTFAT